MAHQSELIGSDINEYLARHERKELLRMLTCGSVDDGKSTLIGRLLHDSKLVYEDQLAAVAAASAKVGGNDGDLNLALLVDGLQAEREQGITIDVAYRYFSTARRKFIIADTPGHEQYTRNMATGASTCDLAVILVDAQNGVQTQTRRHSFIAALLGIRHVIVAVNKMDLVDYDEKIFQHIKDDYLGFSQQFSSTLGSGADSALNIDFIPLSALHGDNVVHASAHTPWYPGPPLMELLETVDIASSSGLQGFRFPVQYVSRPNANFRGYCGSIASGEVHKGDAVCILPANGSNKQHSHIKSIVTYDEELETAFANMAVTLTLEDEIDVSRGDMIVHPYSLPEVGATFEASVVWMAAEPMLPGKEYEFKIGCRNLSGKFKSLRHRIDVNSLQQEPAAELTLNEIGLCEVALQQQAAYDDYQLNRATGAFIVLDRLSNATVAAGMIRQAARKTAQRTKRETSKGANKEAAHVSPHVTTTERSNRYGQKPATIMFVGVSGSGKSTLAHGLERRLFDLGRACTVLDGKTMRLGISKDLPHDAEGRAENLRRSAHIARFLNDSGLICCASFVAPNRDSREHALSVIGRDNCYIVYLNPPIEVCKARDPSGLYAAAAGDDSPDVPGLSFPYEPPYGKQDNCHLELDTAALDVEECLDKVLAMMQTAGVI